jgi:hypothetical protein
MKSNRRRAKARPNERSLAAIEEWRVKLKKWKALLPTLIHRLDGSRYFASPQTEEDMVADGWTPMRCWQRGSKTVDRPRPPGWNLPIAPMPMTEEEYLADGWEPTVGWRRAPQPLDLAKIELADATVDLAIAARREGISALSALRLARDLRGGITPKVLDLAAEVELLSQEIALDVDALPGAQREQKRRRQEWIIRLVRQHARARTLHELLQVLERSGEFPISLEQLEQDLGEIIAKGADPHQLPPLLEDHLDALDRAVVDQAMEAYPSYIKSGMELYDKCAVAAKRHRIPRPSADGDPGTWRARVARLVQLGYLKRNKEQGKSVRWSGKAMP